MRGPVRRGLWLALLSVMLMAGWYPAMKQVLHRISPLQAASIEAIAISVVAAVWTRLHPREYAEYSSRGWWFFSFLNAGALALLYLSLANLSPIIVSLVGRAYVVVCAILGLLVLGERLSWGGWCLITISTASTVVFVHGDAERVSLWGVGAAAGYVCCFAVANVWAKRYTPSADPQTALLWSRMVAAFALPILGIIIEGRAFFRCDLSAALWVLVSSLVTMFGGLWLYYRALPMAPFAYVNALRALGPLFVFLYALPFEHRTPSLSQWIAGLICVASVGALALLPKRLSQKERPEKSHDRIQ